MTPASSASEPAPIKDIAPLLTPDQVAAGLTGRMTPAHWESEDVRFLTKPGRRWRLAVHRTASGAMLPFECDGAHFPSLNEQAREMLKGLAAMAMPHADPRLTPREILTQRGYEVIWVEQRLTSGS